jgi:glucose/arabinose dehydrogenase
MSEKEGVSMNMNRYLSTGMALAVCLVTAVSAQEAKEQKVKLKDVPAPVAAAAAKAYPNAKIREWAKETEAGKMQYEASMVEGATKRDVLFAPDGTVMAVEEVISIAELPAAVKNTIKAKYPQGVIHSAEKITGGKEVQYEIGLKKAAKKEVVLTADGKIVKEE